MKPTKAATLKVTKVNQLILLSGVLLSLLVLSTDALAYRNHDNMHQRHKCCKGFCGEPVVAPAPKPLKAFSMLKGAGYLGDVKASCLYSNDEARTNPLNDCLIVRMSK